METIRREERGIPDLERHLGYLLRRVSNAVSGGFAKALEGKQTSVAEWVLLRELAARGEATPGEMAGRLGLTRGAVSKIVDKLEAKGWVQMEAEEGDGRFRRLSVTRAGRASLPVLARIADGNDAAYFDCLSGKEKVVLRGLLIKLAEQHGLHEVAME